MHLLMKSTSNKKLSQLPIKNNASSLRMVYKNEEVISETANAIIEKEKSGCQTQAFCKKSHSRCLMIISSNAKTMIRCKL